MSCRYTRTTCARKRRASIAVHSLDLLITTWGGSSTKSWGLQVPRGQSYLEDSKWDNRTYPTDKHVYNPKSQCNEPSRGEGMIESICNFPGVSGTRAMRIKAVVMKHGMVPEFELLSQAIDASHPGQQPIQAFCMAIWRRSGSETETLGREAYQRFLGIEIERSYQRIIIINSTPYIYCSEHAVDFPTRETSLCVFCK